MRFHVLSKLHKRGVRGRVTQGQAEVEGRYNQLTVFLLAVQCIFYTRCTLKLVKWRLDTDERSNFHNTPITAIH